jgi:hypothetical protein
MELIGFSIDSVWISLESGANSFDLHGNFDFRSMSCDLPTRTLELRWKRGEGDGIVPTQPDELRLTFSGVHLLKVQERDPAMPFTEDDCLSTIGFIWNESISKMEGWASNRPSEGCDHLVLAFMSGFSIKVGAESARLDVAGGA